MDGEKFDDLLRRFCTTRLTRLDALRGLVAGAAAALTGATLASEETDAKKKGGKSRHKGGKSRQQSNKGKARSESRVGAEAKGKGKSAGKKGKSKNKNGAANKGQQPQSNQRVQAQSASDYCNIAPGEKKVAFCHNSDANNGGTVNCPDDSAAGVEGHCGHNIEGSNPLDCFCPNGGWNPAVHCVGINPPLQECARCDPVGTQPQQKCQFCVPELCPPPTNDCQVAVCKNNRDCGFDNKPNGTACTYNGTVPDCQEAVCSAGACVLQNDDGAAGDACTPATPAPQCQKAVCGSGVNAGTCVYTADAGQNGDACTYDGTVPDCQESVCSAGACVLQGDAGQVGDPCDFDGTVGQCETAVCGDGANLGICIKENKPNNTPCSDGKACTVGDKCVDGQCVSGGTKECTSTNVCKPNCICVEPSGDCVCTGTTCTLTQGYWKNHTGAWPASAGFTTTTPFFSSGKTYLGAMLASSSDGNGYYSLAQQYIAALLNKASGACVPPAVQAAIDSATGLFTSATGGSFTKTQKTTVTNLIKILTDYNEGTTGPGHCA